MDKKPTLGSIVYYYAYRDIIFNGDKTFFAAMITDVQESAGTVSLSIFTDNGIFFRHNIPQGTESGHWDWMPNPNPETVCEGQCEGIGFYPENDMANTDWQLAHSKPHKEPCDGFHFVRCIKCNGTGRRDKKFNP